MSWLQKRTQASDSIQFYSTSMSKTKLLVGLGNIGKEYDGTRHNIGFAVLDAFVAANSEMEPWQLKKNLKCHVSSGRIGDVRVLAIKPTTFMNLSGEAVQAVETFYKTSLADTLVVHDELDINFGQIRLRSGGSSAGHNGLKSIIQHLGADFGRMRIGIGPKKPAAIDSADFVLQSFSKTEQAQMSNLTKEATAILSEYIFGNELPQETRSFLL